ncbi:MAG: 3,4-dihydroxybenzoate decarboxylase [Actinobacteria bacterium RBG_16_64_13]|nr:MAG: 3,4-dihydroxybenzoate decarboxylase [Actinobacteria bacterium RBG_16_64_13]
MDRGPELLNTSDINDLRTALDFLAQTPGQLVSTRVEVDPYLELAGVYRRVGAGTPVAPPTQIGPAMLFENVKGYAMSVVAGILASRKRTALLVGSTPERLAFDLLDALNHTVAPVVVARDQAPCQEVVIKPPFDINEVIPPIVCTKRDTGPFFNLGLMRAEDPESGVSDVTIHRMCVHGPDTLSVSFTPGRHIDVFRLKAEAAGKPLPVSVSIGADPAIYLATSFEAPTTPLGFDELTIAGGLRNRPVELVECVTQRAKAIARAEIVLEGEFWPGERVDEDALTDSGWAMPEFPGYIGEAQRNLPVLHVTAITHRLNPILQILVGPGEEHVTLSGLPTEASIFRLVEDAIPGFLQNVYCHPGGGGKYLAILQIKKRLPTDEGRQRQAALVAFAAFSELKHVILVDEDVDLYDSTDVMWAMTTRFQGDISTIFIPGVKCHTLDPSGTPAFNPMLRDSSISCKTIFDCTVPFALKERFERSPFVDVDLGKYFPPDS